MELEQLNQMLRSFRELRLAPFAPNRLSRSLLKDGGYLYLSAVADSLMVYMKVERLGEVASDRHQIFEELLAGNITGGRYGNIRIAYDRDTTVIWLCHDISLEHLSAQQLEARISDFISGALRFRDYIRDKVLQEVLEEEPVMTAADNPAVFMQPLLEPVSTDSEDSVFKSPVFTEEDEDDLSGEPALNVMVAQAMFMMA